MPSCGLTGPEGWVLCIGKSKCFHGRAGGVLSVAMITDILLSVRLCTWRKLVLMSWTGPFVLEASIT